MAPRTPLEMFWIFLCLLLSGYLIISGGKRWVWSTNKRCLNKLAPGHIIQTLGIVLCWQAPTGREPPEQLLRVGLLRSTRISWERKILHRYLHCCTVKIQEANHYWQLEVYLESVIWLLQCALTESNLICICCKSCTFWDFLQNDF